MADHLPLFDGSPVTRLTSAAVTGGRLVKPTAPTAGGTPTVAHTSGAGVVSGVAGRDAASGQLVIVYRGGRRVHELFSDGAITAGTRVQSAADGKIAAWAGTVDADIIGHAESAISAGATGEVLLY
jgi:hypothetical protein